MEPKPYLFISSLHGDDSTNITNEAGTEAMNFDIEDNPYNLNKVTDFEVPEIQNFGRRIR